MLIVLTDDGSSSCCCWTNAERALSLLRLHDELPQATFESTDWTLRWIGRGKKAFKTNICHLEQVVNKYNKITVKNYGSLMDSFDQDFIITASPDGLISTSDENLLKVILINACYGKSWVSPYPWTNWRILHEYMLNLLLEYCNKNLVDVYIFFCLCFLKF